MSKVRLDYAIKENYNDKYLVKTENKVVAILATIGISLIWGLLTIWIIIEASK